MYLVKQTIHLAILLLDSFLYACMYVCQLHPQTIKLDLKYILIIYFIQLKPFLLIFSFKLLQFKMYD